MIAKKLLAFSCLFLAVPVCAMKRNSRAGRRALVRRSFVRSKYFGRKRLSTAILSGKKKRQKNKTFTSGGPSFGVPINFVAKRLLCTDEVEELVMQDIKKHKQSKESWLTATLILGSPVLLTGGLFAVGAVGCLAFGHLPLYLPEEISAACIEHYGCFVPPSLTLLGFAYENKKYKDAQKRLEKYRTKKLYI